MIRVAYCWPGLDAAERCLLLDAMKRGLCDCHEVCDAGSETILAAARAAGEIP